MEKRWIKLREKKKIRPEMNKLYGVWGELI